MIRDRISQFTVNANDIEIAWRSWQQGLELRMLEVQVSDRGGKRLAQIPQLVTFFATRDLREGRLRPIEIRVVGLEAQAQLTGDGDFVFLENGAQAPDAKLFSSALAVLKSPTGSEEPLASVQRIGFVQSRLVLSRHDGTTPLIVHMSEGSLTRTADGLDVAATLGIPQRDGDGTVRLTATASPAQPDVLIALSMTDVRPETLAFFSRRFELLQYLDIPLGGEGTLNLTTEGSISSAGIEIRGGAGRLTVEPTVIQQTGGGSGWLPQTIPISSVALSATLGKGATTVTMDALVVEFAKGAHVRLPSPLDHPLPLLSLRGSGRYADGVVDVHIAELDLDGPDVALKARLDRVDGQPRIDADIKVTDLGFDDASRYWPPALAPGAHDWVTTHLSQGNLLLAEASVSLMASSSGWTINRFDGEMSARGVKVDFLPPMPPIVNASGRARFDLERFTVEAIGENADGLRVTDATVVISNFDHAVERIEIDLTVEGPLPAALGFIDSDPLAYTRTLGLEPSKTQGQSATRVRLGFPLLKALRLQNIDVDATAHLTSIVLADAVAGADLSDGHLLLNVNGSGMDASGKVTLSGIDGRLTWRENFVPDSAFRSQFEFSASDAPVAWMRDRFINGVLAAELPIGGMMSFTSRLIRSRDRPDLLSVTADLTDTSMSLRPLRWVKPAGSIASLKADAVLSSDQRPESAEFTFASAGLAIEGDARFQADGSMDWIQIAHLAFGRTNVSATIARMPDGWDGSVGGDSLDLEPIRVWMRQKPGTDPPSVLKLPRLSLALDVDRLWLSETQDLRQVVGTYVHEGDVWTLVQMDAAVDDGSPIGVRLTPIDGGSRRLNVSADNAGSALRTLGIFSDIRGGRLALDAILDDDRPRHSVQGEMIVRDYRVVNAPFLARLLSILALSGIADALRAEGISFSTLDVPFRLEDDVLTISEAKAYGSAIGITGSGTIETGQGTADIQGTIVPFYLVNAALGRLPLIGDVFTGGEEGGGLFAATYAMTGPIEDPTIAVNPFSILAPSFLREIFSFFEGGSSANETPVSPNGTFPRVIGP
jgi:hypothetical protein